MAETMNMMELPIDRLVQEIKYELEDENYDPVMILGKSGVGKTMSIFELTQELGIGFCEMRLVTMTEVDLLGIPYQDEYGATTYASNALLPREDRDGEKGILVLDEITSAISTVRAAAYQLLDSKRALGNYKLPAKWKVVALGNGVDDGGVYTGMEGAFLSRCTCYRTVPDLKAFTKWALKNEVSSTILAFLKMRPDYLHKFDPDEIASVFPCPRSWTALSKKLNAREKRAGGVLEQDSVEIYAAGAVGIEAASPFSTFYAFNKKAINVEDIIEGNDNTPLEGIESEVIYIAIQSLVAELTRRMNQCKQVSGKITDEAFDYVCNVINWAVKVGNIQLDYGTAVFQDLAVGCEDFKNIILMDVEGKINQKCPEFDAFCSRMDPLLTM